MSAITGIADAVAASLNGGSFNPAFTAERKHLPVFDLSQVGDALQVSVVPRSVAVSGGSRTANFFDIAVDIGVQKRIDTEDLAQADELLDLVEAIGDHLRLKRLETYPQAAWLALEHEPVIAAEHLEKLRVFTSVLTVTYRVRR